MDKRIMVPEESSGQVCRGVVRRVERRRREFKGKVLIYAEEWIRLVRQVLEQSSDWGVVELCALAQKIEDRAVVSKSHSAGLY